MSKKRNRDEGKSVVTVCSMKNSHFSLCVVFQCRYESICLSILTIYLFLNKIEQVHRGSHARWAYLKSHAYSIYGVRHHVDRERGCGRLDHICNHLENRSENNYLSEIALGLIDMRCPSRRHACTHFSETEFIC